MKPLSLQAKLYVYAIAACGLWVLYIGLTQWYLVDPLRVFCYLVLAILAARLKVSLPGVSGTMSVNFLFILLGVLELSFSGTLIVGMAGGLTQCFWRVKKQPSVQQVLFNAGS